MTVGGGSAAETSPEVFSQYIGQDFPKEMSNDDRLDGMFPARVRILKNGHAGMRVMYHEKTVADIVDGYTTSDDTELSFGDIDYLYTTGGILHAVLRDCLEQKDISVINDIYRQLASVDRLSAQILDAGDAGELTDNEITTLLRGLHEGWVTADPAIVNAGRMAVSLAAFVDKGEHSGVIERLKKIMLPSLSETIERWPNYKKTMNAFGNYDQENVAANFANAFPQLELIGSFPMPVEEALDFAQEIFSS